MGKERLKGELNAPKSAHTHNVGTHMPSPYLGIVGGAPAGDIYFTPTRHKTKNLFLRLLNLANLGSFPLHISNINLV